MIRLAKCLDRINGYVPKELKDCLTMYQGVTTMIATNIDILEYTNLVCKAKQFPRNVFFQALEKMQLQLLLEVEDIMSTICFTLKNILQLRCASQPCRSFIENLLDERCTVNL